MRSQKQQVCLKYNIYILASVNGKEYLSGSKAAQVCKVEHQNYFE
jgi:hypothetical protein